MSLTRAFAPGRVSARALAAVRVAVGLAAVGLAAFAGGLFRRWQGQRNRRWRDRPVDAFGAAGAVIHFGTAVESAVRASVLRWLGLWTCR